MSRKVLLFLTMTIIWGSTWIPCKIGLAVVPPVMFAGIRFVPAGLLLIALWRWKGNGPTIARRDCPRLLLVGLLMTTVSYALMFWALLYIRTGFAAVVDFTVVPIFLLAFGLAAGEEQFHARQALAIGLGVSGLFILFLPSLTGRSNPDELVAALAVIASVASYCWGSILARPLLRRYSSFAVSGFSNFAGGVVLVLLSLAFEDGALAGLDLARWTPAIWLSWIGLFLFGTVIAATIFLVLLREWGPARAGSYAFCSPTIAVVLGMLVFDEKVGPVEALGMAVMLTATWLALRQPAAAPAAAE